MNHDDGRKGSLPKFNITTENWPFAPKGNELVFQPAFFRGKLAVKLRREGGKGVNPNVKDSIIWRLQLINNPYT